MRRAMIENPMTADTMLDRNRRAAQLAEIGDVGIVEFYRRCGRQLDRQTVNRGVFTITQGASTDGTGFIVPVGTVAVVTAIRQMTTPLVQKRVTGWPIKYQFSDSTGVYPIQGARPSDARMSWPNGKGPSLAELDVLIENTRVTPGVVLGAGTDAKAIHEIDLVIVPTDEYFACSTQGIADMRQLSEQREDELLYAVPWDSNVARDSGAGALSVNFAAEVGAEHVLERIKVNPTAGGAVTVTVDATADIAFVAAAGGVVNYTENTAGDSNESLTVGIPGGGNLRLSGKTWRLRGT